MLGQLLIDVTGGITLAYGVELVKYERKPLKYHLTLIIPEKERKIWAIPRNIARVKLENTIFHVQTISLIIFGKIETFFNFILLRYPELRYIFKPLSITFLFWLFFLVANG